MTRTMQNPGAVLMVEPAYFDVIYSINPHMEGNIGKIDQKRAGKQWEAIRKAYEGIGFPVHVMPGEKGLVDMVFTANQSFPFLSEDGKKRVLLSKMRSGMRQPEVPFFADWFKSQGYETVHLSGKYFFEGMGDLLWHPGRRELLGGYGPRTDPGVYEEVTWHTEIPILKLELVDPSFYHLDTCLSPITEFSALYYPEAFTKGGVKLLKKQFPDLIPVSKKEAFQFVCNGHSPDGKYFLLQSGSPVVCAELRDRAIIPIELDTSEFMKSGGSVFCMKMMVW